MKKKIDEYLSNALTAFSTNQYAVTHQWCNAILDLEPNAKAYSLKGKSYIVQGKLYDAVNCFKQAIKLNQREGEHYFNLGICHYGMESFNEALKCFVEAEKYGISNESKMKMFYIAGIINQNRKDNDAALINFKKSETIKGVNPDQRDILLRKIQIYVGRRLWEDAENCARQLKFISPNEFQTYQLLSQIYVQQKKNKEAKDILEEALMYFKDNNEILIEIDFSYASLNYLLAKAEPENMQFYYENAMRYLNHILTNPALQVKEKCKVIINLIDIYREMGDIDNVILMSEKIADKTNVELLEDIERAKYNLVGAYLIKKQYVKVKKYASELKQSKNQLYCYHGYYMEAYSQMMMAKAAPDLRESAIKMYQIAIAYYRNCMAGSAGDFFALTYRIKANADIGQFEKAEELCKLLPLEAREQIMQYIHQCKDE